MPLPGAIYPNEYTETSVIVPYPIRIRWDGLARAGALSEEFLCYQERI